MLQKQLLAPVHDTEPSSKESAPGAEAAQAPETPNFRHGHGIAAGIVDGQLELEGELVLTRLQGVRSVRVAAAGVVLVGKDLLHLIKELVTLADDAAGRSRRRTVLQRAAAILMGMRDLQGSGGLAFKFDHDAAKLLRASEAQDDLARNEVKVSIELGPIVEGYPKSHGSARKLKLADKGSGVGGFVEYGRSWWDSDAMRGDEWEHKSEVSST